MSRQAPSRTFQVIRIAVLALVSLVFLYLFYHESTGDFYSDIPGHIKFAMAENHSSYSLMYPLFVVSYTLFGHMGVAVMLTVLEVGTIVLSERMLRALAPQTRPEAAFALALMLNLAIAIYLPFLHDHFMIGLSSGNSWHNGTFIFMKPVSLAAIWAYLRFTGYLESRSPKLDYILFLAAVITSAAIKPSFVVAFGPALVVMCIWDLLEDRSTLKRSLLISIPFFITVAILAYQYMVLFVEDTSSGIEFGLARVWRHTHFFFPFAMLQSWAFPILVYVFCRKFFKGDRNYRLTLVMFAVALVIFLFVNESGYRKYHGNFGWSLKFAVYYLFLTSIAAFCKSRGRSVRFIALPPSQVEEQELSEVRQHEDGITEPAPSGSYLEEACDGDAGSAPLPYANKVGIPDALILMALLWHTASGIGNIINILSGNGYG